MHLNFSPTAALLFRLILIFWNLTLHMFVQMNFSPTVTPLFRPLFWDFRLHMIMQLNLSERLLLFWDCSSEISAFTDYLFICSSSCTWTSHRPPPFCSDRSWSSETLLFTCSCKWTSHQPPPFCSDRSSETLVFTCKWTSHQRPPLYWNRYSETLVFSCVHVSESFTNGHPSAENLLLKRYSSYAQS